jgi:hypothetical protein
MRRKNCRRFFDFSKIKHAASLKNLWSTIRKRRRLARVEKNQVEVCRTASLLLIRYYQGYYCTGKTKDGCWGERTILKHTSLSFCSWRMHVRNLLHAGASWHLLVSTHVPPSPLGGRMTDLSVQIVDPSPQKRMLGPSGGKHTESDSHHDIESHDLSRVPNIPSFPPQKKTTDKRVSNPRPDQFCLT